MWGFGNCKDVVLMAGIPVRAYQKLGIVHANTSLQSRTETTLRQKADRKGANAVINVFYNSYSNGIRGHGTAVKWV